MKIRITAVGQYASIKDTSKDEILQKENYKLHQEIDELKIKLKKKVWSTIHYNNVNG